MTRVIWDLRAIAILILIMLAASSCASSRAPTTAPASAPPQWVLFADDLPGELRICVPLRPLPTASQPHTCILLRDLRTILRARRLAGTVDRFLQLP